MIGIIVHGTFHVVTAIPTHLLASGWHSACDMQHEVIGVKCV